MMKYTAEELANKLEQKAKELRENGITSDDMDKVAGGSGCTCCGSSCQVNSNRCVGMDETSQVHAFCKHSCVDSSPD